MEWPQESTYQPTSSETLQSCQLADFESAKTSKHKGNSSLYEGEDNFWLFQAEEIEHIAHHAAIVDKEIEQMAKNLLQIELDEDESSQEWDAHACNHWYMYNPYRDTILWQS